MNRWLLAVVLVAGCKESATDVSPPPVVVAAEPAPAPEEAAEDPLETLTLAALEKRMAIKALLDVARAGGDPKTWPKADVPGLDFTHATGNAVVVHVAAAKLSDTLTDTPPFKLFHLEDDPYRLATAARGIGLKDGQDAATFRSTRYLPALNHLVRAKYALLVIAEVESPQAPLGKRFAPGTLKGAALLYELETAALLGGFPLAAINSDTVRTKTGNVTGEELATLVDDFETNARTALWKGVKARFPSAVPMTTAYLDGQE